MAITQHHSSITRRSLRAAPLLLGVAALSLISGSARADVCFPVPGALPGLSGVPIWKAPGVVRTELNEPRWAAAPQLGFDSDATGNEGLYRIMVDAADSTLVVSFQAPTDLGTPSNADVIYFGFTTDGTTGAQAKGVAIQVNGSGGTDPSDAAVIQQQNYNAGTWTSPLGAPSWLKDASVWRNIVTGDATWGINFKVDLASAGLSATSAFKILLAMHKEDEVTPALSVNLSTPDPAGNPLLPGTLFINNPAQWATATAINAGCVGGITIQGNQIGTTNTDMGNPAPNEINTTTGAVNQFYAKPTIPGSIALFPGLFQAKFHLANWGSIAASNAPWTPLNGGTPVANGVAPAADNATVEFNCPANTATQTCGIATPAEHHQCVYVELSPAPSQVVPITKASAFTNMWFKPLSEFATPAEISVKGLKKIFNNDLPRDVYVYVYPKNMPAQGSKQIYLPTDKMAATRRFYEAPPPVVRHPEGKPNPIGLVGRGASTPALPAVAQPKLAAQPASVAPKPAAAAVAVAAPGKLSSARTQPPVELPLPHTGIGDLDLNPLQALAAVWPTFDVHVYYDSGKTITIGGRTSKQLVPMYPFTSFHSHEGPLYGFSHSLKPANGAQLKELRPDVFLLAVPSESVAHVVTTVTAHEQPLGNDGGSTDCPKPPPVEPHDHCGCRIPGSRSSLGTPWTWLGLAALTLGLGRRLRPSRSKRRS